MHGMCGSSQPVVCELPFAFSLDEPHAPQIGEVPRDGGLRKLKDLHYVAHAELTRGEYAQNANAGGVRKTLEHFVKVGDRRRWKSGSHDTAVMGLSLHIWLGKYHTPK